MSRYQDKKKRIFKKFSTNLQLLIDEPSRRMRFFDPITNNALKGDFYACPLCLKCFEESAIDNKTLTGEDVPPKSVGGRVIVLTCKNCNNNSGSNLDLHISKALDLSNFIKEKKAIQAKIGFLGNNKFKGAIKMDTENRIFHFLIPNNQYTAAQLELIKENWNEGEINFIFEGPNSASLERAIARMAYLKMFEIFGYSYIFSRGGWKLRNFILGEEQNFKLIVSIDQSIKKPEGIYLVTKPDNARSFMVCLNLRRNDTVSPHFIFVPGPTKDAIKYYESFPLNPGTLWFRDLNMEADFLKSQMSFDIIWQKLLEISSNLTV